MDVGGVTSAGSETTTAGGGMAALTNVGAQGKGDQEGERGAASSGAGEISNEWGVDKEEKLAEGDGKDEGLDKKDLNEGDLVEVPALGETEKSGFPWWILVVLLITGVGMASWLLYGRKRQKEE